MIYRQHPYPPPHTIAKSRQTNLDDYVRSSKSRRTYHGRDAIVSNDVVQAHVRLVYEVRLPPLVGSADVYRIGFVGEKAGGKQEGAE